MKISNYKYFHILPYFPKQIVFLQFKPILLIFIDFVDMKSNSLLNLSLIFVFAFFVSCDGNFFNQSNIIIQNISSVDDSIKFKSFPVIKDSLLIKIPGKNGTHPLKIVSSKLPEKAEFNNQKRIIPGKSFLPLSEEDKRAGISSVKSKKAIVKHLKESVSYRNDKAQDKPIEYKLLNPLIIENDSILVFECKAEKLGLFSIQNGDTIFPPVAISTNPALRTEAKDFEYKDDAIYDISFLGENQNLPNSYIRAMAKDTMGVIWIASHTGGLISYDGQFFEQYIEKNGLSDHEIISMIIDSKNRIWLGTASGGVNCYDGKQIIQYTVKQGLPSNFVLSIVEDAKGKIWFGTSKGLACLNGNNLKVYTVKQGLAMNAIFSLLEDKNGNLWIGTYGKGLQKWDGDSFTTYSSKDGLAANKILCLMQDHAGDIWVGTQGGGVSHFNGKAFYNYSIDQGLGNSNILSIVETADNTMWFGTFGNGLTKFDGEAFSSFTTNEGLSDNYIRSLFIDGEGNLWIGTDGEGISKFKTSGFKHFTKEQGLQDKLIVSVYQDNKNRMWFGAFEKGLMITNSIRNNEDLKTYIPISSEQGLVNDIVTYVFQDDSKNYWFATYGGGVSKLDYLALESGKIKFTNITTLQGLKSDIIRMIIDDDEGNIWFATQEGATKYDGEKLITYTKKAGLPSSDVVSLFRDNENAIWIGTRGGGVARLKNDKITTFNKSNGLANNTVWVMNQDKNGLIWFGTDGGGLSYFDGKKFVNINTGDGLCNNFVFSLTIDKKNNLWVGTTRGLSKITLNPAASNDAKSNYYADYQINNFGNQDGLKSLDFYQNSAMLDKFNELWFGTVSALTVLDLQKNLELNTIPKVHINSILVNDKDINFINNNSSGINEIPIETDSLKPFLYTPYGLRLPNNLNHLTFNFSATNWAAPHQILYQFKLKGLDGEWNSITHKNTADYRNIPPGKYSFLVKAKGVSGKWSNIYEFPFMIRYPWWKSWWAIIIYLIALVGLIWLIVKLRVRNISRQKDELELMVDERTKDLDKALNEAKKASLAKSQFVARMSHEVRTPLTAIMGFTKLLLDNKPSAKNKDYLTKIDRSANTMLSLINEILDFSKMESGKMELENIEFDIEILLNSIIILNHKQIYDKNLDLIIAISPNIPKKLLGDSLRLGQIITNLIGNAVKFTEKGKILIDVNIKEKISSDELLLQFAVKDNGIGIDKSQIPHLFDEFQQADNSITRRYGGTGLGLTISKSLVNKMGGQIWVESKQNEGSTFYFTIKVITKSNKLICDNIIAERIKNLNILVCDNNQASNNILKQYFDSLYFNTSLVESRVELLNELDKEKFDLLILDQETCDLNTDEGFVKILSGNDERPIKTIILTKSEENINKHSNTLNNFDGYLVKPILPTALFEKILKVFNFENISSPSEDVLVDNLEEVKLGLCCNNILLAEDNVINSQVIIELLENVKANVEWTDNGANAVKKTMDTNYDIILMDLHMPIMDGYYAAKQIRKHNAGVPIIAITADVRSSVNEKCKRSGINDIVTKPINPDLLYNTLLKWSTPKDKSECDSKKDKSLIEKNSSLPNIKNLNIDAGLKRIGGNTELYLKMLNRFMLGNNNICGEIGELINSSDFSSAHLKVHSLKGESANLEAENVFMLSKQLEKSVLEKNKTEAKKDLRLLDNELQILITELEEYFTKNKLVDTLQSVPLKELVNNLIENLKMSNPKVLDLLDTLNERIPSSKLIKDITKEVNAGNTDEACVLLNKLLEGEK